MVERRASVAAGGRRISVSGHLATLGRPGSSGGGAKAGGDDSKPLQLQQQTRRSMMMRRSMVASGGASGGTLPPASGPVGSGGGVGASRASMLSKSSSVPAVGSGGARVSIMASKSSGRASMVSPMLPKRRPVLRGAPVSDAAVRAVLSKPFEARTYDDIRVVRRRLVSMGWGRRLFDSEMGAHPFRVDELCRRITLQRYAPGEEITTAGTPAKMLYVVFSGVVTQLESETAAAAAVPPTPPSVVSSGASAGTAVDGPASATAAVAAAASTAMPMVATGGGRSARASEDSCSVLSGAEYSAGGTMTARKLGAGTALGSWGLGLVLDDDALEYSLSSARARGDDTNNGENGNEEEAVELLAMDVSIMHTLLRMTRVESLGGGDAGGSDLHLTGLGLGLTGIARDDEANKPASPVEPSSPSSPASRTSPARGPAASPPSGAAVGVGSASSSRALVTGGLSLPGAAALAGAGGGVSDAVTTGPVTPRTATRAIFRKRPAERSEDDRLSAARYVASRIDFFRQQNFTAAQQVELISVLELAQVYGKGRAIFEEGCPGAALYIIFAGEVDIYVSRERERDRRANTQRASGDADGGGSAGGEGGEGDAADAANTAEKRVFFDTTSVGAAASRDERSGDEDGTNGEPDDGGSGSMFGDAKPVISPTHAERAAHHGAPAVSLLATPLAIQAHHVATLKAGQSFGERALESSLKAPSAATAGGAGGASSDATSAADASGGVTGAGAGGAPSMPTAASGGGDRGVPTTQPTMGGGIGGIGGAGGGGAAAGKNLREATVKTASELVELLVLSADHYKALLHKFREQQLAEREKLLRRTPGFDALPPHVLREVCGSFEEKKYLMHDKLCEQGAPAQMLCVLLRGEARLERRVSVTDERVKRAGASGLLHGGGALTGAGGGLGTIGGGGGGGGGMSATAALGGGGSGAAPSRRGSRASRSSETIGGGGGSGGCSGGGSGGGGSELDAAHETLQLGRAGVGTVVGPYVVEHVGATQADQGAIVWRETVTFEAVSVVLSLFKTDLCFRLSAATREALKVAMLREYDCYESVTGLWPVVRPHLTLDQVDRTDAWDGYKSHVVKSTLADGRERARVFARRAAPLPETERPDLVDRYKKLATSRMQPPLPPRSAAAGRGHGGGMGADQTNVLLLTRAQTAPHGALGVTSGFAVGGGGAVASRLRRGSMSVGSFGGSERGSFSERAGGAPLVPMPGTPKHAKQRLLATAQAVPPPDDDDDDDDENATAAARVRGGRSGRGRATLPGGGVDGEDDDDVGDDAELLRYMCEQLGAELGATGELLGVTFDRDGIARALPNDGSLSPSTPGSPGAGGCGASGYSYGGEYGGGDRGGAFGSRHGGVVDELARDERGRLIHGLTSIGTAAAEKEALAAGAPAGGDGGFRVALESLEATIALSAPRRPRSTAAFTDRRSHPSSPVFLGTPLKYNHAAAASELLALAAGSGAARKAAASQSAASLLPNAPATAAAARIPTQAQHPFSLVQVHTADSGAAELLRYSRRGGALHQNGVIYPNNELKPHHEFRVRFLGTFPSAIEGHALAEAILSHDGAKERPATGGVRAKNEPQPPMFDGWRRFTGYDMLDLSRPSHFVMFCRDSPIESLSFSGGGAAGDGGAAGGDDDIFPPMCKVPAQSWACVSVRYNTADDALAAGEGGVSASAGSSAHPGGASAGEGILAGSLVGGGEPLARPSTSATRRTLGADVAASSAAAGGSAQLCLRRLETLREVHACFPRREYASAFADGLEKVPSGCVLCVVPLYKWVRCAPHDLWRAFGHYFAPVEGGLHAREIAAYIDSAKRDARTRVVRSRGIDPFAALESAAVSSSSSPGGAAIGGAGAAKVANTAPEPSSPSSVGAAAAEASKLADADDATAKTGDGSESGATAARRRRERAEKKLKRTVDCTPAEVLVMNAQLNALEAELRKDLLEARSSGDEHDTYRLLQQIEEQRAHLFSTIQAMKLPKKKKLGNSGGAPPKKAAPAKAATAASVVSAASSAATAVAPVDGDSDGLKEGDEPSMTCGGGGGASGGKASGGGGASGGGKDKDGAKEHLWEEIARTVRHKAPGPDAPEPLLFAIFDEIANERLALKAKDMATAASGPPGPPPELDRKLVTLDRMLTRQRLASPAGKAGGGNDAAAGNNAQQQRTSGVVRGGGRSR